MSGHERAFPRPSRMRWALVPVVPPFTGNRYPSAVHLLALSHRDASRGWRGERTGRASVLVALIRGSSSFCHTNPRRSPLSVSLSLSLWSLFLLPTPGLLPFGPALFIPPSVSSRSLRNIRIDPSGPVRSFFLSFFSVRASPAHNIHFHHLSRAAAHRLRR